MALSIQEEIAKLKNVAEQARDLRGDTKKLGSIGFVQNDDEGNDWVSRRYKIVYHSRVYNRLQIERQFGPDRITAYIGGLGIDIWVSPSNRPFNGPYTALHSSGFFRYQTNEGDIYESHPDGRQITRASGSRLLDKQTDGSYLAHEIVGKIGAENMTQEDVDRLFPDSMFASSFLLEETVADYRSLFGELA